MISDDPAIGTADDMNSQLGSTQMDDQSVRIRVCKSTGEIEIEGQPELVRQWWDELRAEFFDDQSKPTAALANRVAAGDVPQGADTMPETFGEYLHRFPANLSDNDRMLIAASFVERASEDRAFTTGASNQLLVDQGIRLANPSVCVQRLTTARKVFRLTGNNFRVSAEGKAHLTTLTAGGS